MEKNPETAAAGDRQLVPPRERLLAAARDLFGRHGIRAVGVEAIAEHADSNKMTLYRHFESKDLLVAEYLRQLAAEADASWDALASAHPGDPRGQLLAWVEGMSHSMTDSRGCPLANAAVELPDKAHPARRVIEEHKKGNREQLVRLCREVGASDPELLADSLFLLVEGARVCLQSVGPGGPGANIVQLAEALISARSERPAPHS